MDTMYMENILDHYKNPHNKGKTLDPTFTNREKNPACGDEIEITVKLNAHKEIEDIHFDGHGCAISQAAISLVTEEVKGKHIEAILKMSKKEVLDLLGIEIVPLRIKCAMLGLRVLQRGILKNYGKNQNEISLSSIHD